MTNTNTEKEKYRIQGVGVWEIAHGSMLGKPSPEEWTLNQLVEGRPGGRLLQARGRACAKVMRFSSSA